MKEQTAILPPLPIVGCLEISTRDGKNLSCISVSKKRSTKKPVGFFKMCFDELELFLSGKSKVINIPLDFSGLTPFQLKILKQMVKIPYGQFATYKDLATCIKTKGYQAVGTACGKNPFMLIYPCHRVIGSKDLGGFAHGLEMKKSLLTLEGSLPK
jgi:O-6-methylguanine DNA methyltransferase